MQKLTDLVRRFIPQNPFKQIFYNEESLLDETFYQTLYNALITPATKQKYQNFMSKQRITTLASLRLLFLHFYCIKRHQTYLTKLKQIAWKPVSVHSKLRQRYHAVQIKTIELLQDYFQKIEGFNRNFDTSLLGSIQRCQFILEIMQICGKLLFNLAHRVNIPNEEVFELIYQYLMADSINYFKQLCDFVANYCSLILQQHSQSLTINYIYEKTIYYHRQLQQLVKFMRQPMLVPQFEFDVETNRKIQQKIRDFKNKYAQVEAKKMYSTYTSTTNFTGQQQSSVKLSIPHQN